MSNVPAELKYTAEHEWVREGTPVTIGITENAAEALGELVFIELPAVGDRITAGTVCGEVESTKSVSEIYAPVTGTVAEVNQAVVDEPQLVNNEPYAAGWLLRVDVEDATGLLSAEEYSALLDA
ncbi:glycine cleavage system protein GcvH [Actinotalea sp. BY-33]|uniref:Glycine cleavage system H protein n=1 Tax=Actinotalea soli TaxID=2819234 RepID=A0A939LPK1_9CELL|nr:glycine cleavage system protein GcvH [Actinotalea soli]MBO1751323.1 glycine cleavage system protein GcvH [Actinotalea soli]